MNRTPCHLAAIKNNIECVKVLINNKCDINATDVDDNTILHVASQYASNKCIQYLLNNECNYSINNKSNQTAIDLSANIDIKELFIKFIKEKSKKENNDSPINEINN